MRKVKRKEGKGIRKGDVGMGGTERDAGLMEEEGKEERYWAVGRRE